MKEKPKSPEIEVSERYDREDDVYYVTLKTGEPSMVQEHDDILLVEVGLFTGMPTGFRILQFSKFKDQAGHFKQIFKDMCRKAGLHRIKDGENRQQRIVEFFDKVAA